MENEIWKEIPGYEGLYEVSNYGQIRSIKRLEKCGNKTRIRKERILKQSLRRGYPVQIYAAWVYLCKMFKMWVCMDCTCKVCRID